LAEEAQITEEMYNKVLLATDNKGWTVCHFAVEIYNFVALQKIWGGVQKIKNTGGK